MDVSIIIINYNTFDITSECIRSVYKKTKGLNFEIIVVDNGSVECNPIRFEEDFPQIILVKSVTNLGFARGNNLGIQYAKGKVILLLNSDTKLLNNAVLIGYNRIFQSEKIGALTGKLLYSDGRVQFNAGRFPSIKLIVVEIFRLFYFMPPSTREKVLLGGYFTYNKEIYPDWVWATFLLIKRSVINDFPNGRLPEDFFMYEEDKQWCYYMRRNGFEILFSPEPHILHYGSGSSKQSNTAVAIQSTIIDNEYIFITETRGKLYAKMYFLLKAIQYLTSKYELAKPIAKLYLQKAVSGGNKN